MSVDDPLIGAPSPRVSIVIPAYNSASLLPDTLHGVFAQTFSDWELVIYDDGSSDSTVLVCEQLANGDPRVRIIRGENGGVAAARNRGFESTYPRSEFIIFLDHDDLWEPEMLETLVGILDAKPGYVSAHTIARGLDEEGRQLPDDDLERRIRDRRGFRGRSAVRLSSSEPTTFADLAYHNWIVTPGLHLMRRTSLERVGGFDPQTVPSDDFDLSIRLARLGPIGFSDRPLLGWRRHARTLSSTSPHWRRAEQRARTKMLSDRSNSREQTRAARQGFRRTSRNTLGYAVGQLGRREYRSAFRQSAKALFLYASYIHAYARVRLRRAS
jgi:cellulose synthase/poly-beta-1,6-N-acetylglucosamine synthase-like glycosyltransferase